MEPDITHVEVIANNYHWSITAGTLTLNLNNSPFSVCGSMTRLDSSEMLADSVENLARATEHAGGSGANLHKVLTNRFTVNRVQMVCKTK
jgi:hypothetical protein